MFPLLVCAYPIFETVFTMYRRRFVHRTSTGRPDAMHLHHLVYKRLTRRAFDRADGASVIRHNSMTSPWLWMLCAVAVMPALCFWDRTGVLLAFLGVFMLVYTIIYWCLARLGVPRWIGALLPIAARAC